jgi:hypothetical protein
MLAQRIWLVGIWKKLSTLRSLISVPVRFGLCSSDSSDRSGLLFRRREGTFLLDVHLLYPHILDPIHRNQSIHATGGRPQNEHFKKIFIPFPPLTYKFFANFYPLDFQSICATPRQWQRAGKREQERGKSKKGERK